MLCPKTVLNIYQAHSRHSRVSYCLQPLFHPEYYHVYSTNTTTTVYQLHLNSTQIHVYLAMVGSPSRMPKQKVER